MDRYGLRVEICVGPITNEEAVSWEQEWILKEDTYTENYSFNDPDIRCNFTRGGDGAVGKVVSEEARQRIGEAQRAKPKSQETKDKIRVALYGRKFSDETRQRMSAARRGKSLNEEHKRNLWKNRSHEFTKEHCANISRAQQGRTASEATKKKMSEATKGKQHCCSKCGQLGHLKPKCKVENGSQASHCSD